jgi:hypothetical protein
MEEKLAMDRRDFIKTSVVAGAHAVLARPWAASAEDTSGLKLGLFGFVFWAKLK